MNLFFTPTATFSTNSPPPNHNQSRGDSNSMRNNNQIPDNNHKTHAPFTNVRTMSSIISLRIWAHLDSIDKRYSHLLQQMQTGVSYKVQVGRKGRRGVRRKRRLRALENKEADPLDRERRSLQVRRHFQRDEKFGAYH